MMPTATQLDPRASTDNEPYQPTGWLERMTEEFRRRQIKRDLKHAVTVHPCIINSRRVLIYEQGLAKDNPLAYARLAQYARENGFDLKENQRISRAEVDYERRLAKTMPMLFLASGIFLSSNAAAEEINADTRPSYDEEITVKAVRERNAVYRRYQTRDGKRFVSDPFGNVKAILSVAAQVKHSGKMTRISTRRITMPQNYVGGILHRYDFQFPQSCGGAHFSYYEGDGFGALGLHRGKKVVLDVMVGGGAFSAPQLWGPYDQVLGDRHNSRMKLMMGDGRNDSMGMLKASYAIGMMTDMNNGDMEVLGDDYAKAVADTYSCLPDLPNQQEEPIPQAADIRKVSAEKGKI